MQSDPKEQRDPHTLEDMDQRLYRRDLAGRKPKRFDALHTKRFSFSSNWGPLEKHKDKIEKVATHPTGFKKFFMFTMGFAVLAILFALVTFFTGGNTVSNSNIEIKVLGNAFTPGGEELPLQVEVINKNPSGLELVDLFIEYEKGGDASSGAGHVRDMYSLGSVGAGRTETKNIFVTLYGEEGSSKNINFTLQYRLRGSNAIFVKKETFPVTISSAPIALSVEAPENISPNQEATFVVKVKSNAKDTVSGMLVKIEYPNGFKYASATPEPSSFTNVWDIGDMAPGAEREIKLVGTIYGQDGEDRAFHVYTGAASEKDRTEIGITYNSILKVVSLVKPFLSASLALNGSTQNTVSAASGSNVQGTVSFQNSLDTSITDAEITVKLVGNALDTSAIIAGNGFYNSATNTIIWNKTTNSRLATIEPGDTGAVDFTFKVLPLIQNTVAKPAVKLSVSIKGKQAGSSGELVEVTNFEEKTLAVSSDLGFSVGAFYYTGPFSNSGPIPPQANEPTTYTVTWNVTNSANALSDALAQTTLPSYVEWVGTKSPTSENVEYDSTTRTVRWRIGQIAASGTRSVSYQIRLIPSTSQIGAAPQLTLQTAVSARDTYTGETLSATRTPITTRLTNDTGFPVANGGVVVQ